MRRETRPLIGLEHSVAEGVGLSHREIGLHIRRLHIVVLGIRRRTILLSLRAKNNIQIKTIHGAIVPGGQEIVMAVPHIPRLRQRGGLELYDLPIGNLSATGDVSPILDQYRVLKEIIRRAVLLEDHHYVVNLSWRRRGGWRTAAGTAGTATAVEAHERASDGQHCDCEYQDVKLHGKRYLRKLRFLGCGNAHHRSHSLQS